MSRISNQRDELLRTEFEFTLPHGFLDKHGTLHRDGMMRRAKAVDEISPLRDPRVVRNPAYLVVILLSRVVTRLGTIDEISTHEIQELPVVDFQFLQRLYNKVNALEPSPPFSAICPQCQHEFAVDAADSEAEDPIAGGAPATLSSSSTRR